VRKPKNDEDRIIPICKPLLEEFKRLKTEAKTDYVFVTQVGKPYTHVSSWNTAWNTAIKKADIGHYTFHELRHTFISNLIVGEKEDYATVMALSGHKDITMLQRYSHTEEKAKKEAIKKLENRLNLANIDTYMDTKAENDDLEESNIINLTNSNH